MPESSSSRRAWFLLLASLAVSFGLWHWANRLLIPASTAAALAGGHPIGNNSDLYPRWLGAREALLFRHDPYSDETTRKIQLGFYGRALDPKRPNEPVDQQAFAYPLYVAFLLAPLLTLQFAKLMLAFAWTLLLGTALSVLLWKYALRLKLSAVVVTAAMILAVSNYPMVQGFYKQQLTLLVALLMASAAAGVARGWPAFAGFLLALSTIKPQISGLLILWFLVWTLGEWRSRQRLAWSFLGTMAALVAASEALLPGWIPKFLAAARKYQQYAGDPPTLQVLLGHTVGLAAEAILIAAVLLLFWRWRKSTAGDAPFAWAIALAGTATLALINKTAPYNSVLLLPALLLLAAPTEIGSFWSRGSAKAAFAVQIWQWLAALALSVAALVVTPTWPRWVIQLPLYTVFALPPLALLAVLLSLPRSSAIPPARGESHG